MFDDMKRTVSFSRLDTIHECDKTDRRRPVDSYYCTYP